MDLGHQQTACQVLELALGPSVADYDMADVATAADADLLIQ